MTAKRYLSITNTFLKLVFGYFSLGLTNKALQERQKEAGTLFPPKELNLPENNRRIRKLEKFSESNFPEDYKYIRVEGFSSEGFPETGVSRYFTAKLGLLPS